MPPSPLIKLRKICLSLPGTTEVEAWGSPTFRVGKIFAMWASKSDHHGRGKDSVWLQAAPGNQELMVADAPDRYFVPPYVGPSGWIGVYLEGQIDWDDVAQLVRDAWRIMAPKKLLAEPATRPAPKKKARTKRQKPRG